MISTTDYNDYFKDHFIPASPSSKPIKVPRRPIDWEKDAFSADAVLLEVNEVQMDPTGCGFVEGAIQHLAAHPGGAGGGASGQ